jgi:hypothetical protein
MCDHFIHPRLHKNPVLSVRVPADGEQGVLCTFVDAGRVSVALRTCGSVGTLQGSIAGTAGFPPPLSEFTILAVIMIVFGLGWAGFWLNRTHRKDGKALDQ